MGLIPFFSTAVLIATVASIVLAVVSYSAYKARDRRRPNRDFDQAEIRDVVFFHRYDPSAHRSAVEPVPAIVTEDERRGELR